MRPGAAASLLGVSKGLQWAKIHGAAREAFKRDSFKNTTRVWGRLI